MRKFPTYVDSARQRPIGRRAGAVARTQRGKRRATAITIFDGVIRGLRLSRSLAWVILARLKTIQQGAIGVVAISFPCEGGPLVVTRASECASAYSIVINAGRHGRSIATQMPSYACTPVGDFRSSLPRSCDPMFFSHSLYSGDGMF